MVTDWMHAGNIGIPMVFEQLKIWTTNYVYAFDEKAMLQLMEKQLPVLTAVAQFEAQLADNLTEVMIVYEAYIQFEIEQGNPVRVQMAYERNYNIYIYIYI